MANRVVITNGRVLDPSTGLDEVSNIYIMGGRVASIKASASDDSPLEEGAPGLDIIDAAGKLVVPGLVDIHTHLREPGFEYKETVLTGAEAAAAGGFTTILCMANTEPVNDNQSVTRYILKKAESAPVHVLPIGAVSMGLEGKSLTEMGELKEAGCVAFSDDGIPVKDGVVMRRALEYSAGIGSTVISHAEEPDLVRNGVMNEGAVSTRLGLPGIPNAAEDSMISRDIMLSELTGGRLHIAHVSTSGGVDLIRAAQARGVNVTAEVAPHHITLTDTRVTGYDTNAKMNPPLRRTDDIEALIEGLSDGTIGSVATDHAPHSVIEKDVEFAAAANGIIGLETAFSLLYGLVLEDKLTLERVIEAMTIGPAKAMGLSCGSLRVGAAADITIIDLDAEWKVEADSIVSKSKNSPYIGCSMNGRVERTMVNGKMVFTAT